MNGTNLEVTSNGKIITRNFFKKKGSPVLGKETYPPLSLQTHLHTHTHTCDLSL